MQKMPSVGDDFLSSEESVKSELESVTYLDKLIINVKSWHMHPRNTLPMYVIVVGVNMDRRDARDYWCMEIKSKREKERQTDRAKMKA